MTRPARCSCARWRRPRREAAGDPAGPAAGLPQCPPPDARGAVLAAPEACAAFYGGLGLTFTVERHGAGPAHHAAVLGDGAVVEIYPARRGAATGPVRLALSVAADATSPRLTAGRHVLTDPDGRTVEVTAV